MDAVITTIIFDLSEVYLKGFKDVEIRLAPVLGVSPEHMHLHEGPDLGLLFNGKITEDEYWQNVIKKNGWFVDADLLKSAVRKNFEEIEGTRDIIETLKERGLKLGLLSVHAREWIDFCQKKFDYHKLFHSVSYSFEVGASKPDKRAYLLILEKLKSRPEDCMFIDDNPDNLKTADMLGMTTILFKNPKQLRTELTKRNIL